MAKSWTGVLIMLIWGGCAVREFPVHVQKDAIVAMAAHAKPALWDIDLGPTLVEEMHLLGPDRMLVDLRKYDQALSGGEYLLIDRKKGSIIWRFDRRAYLGNSSLVGRSNGILVFGIHQKNKSMLLAVDEISGLVTWHQTFNGEVQFVTTESIENVIIVDANANGTDLAAFNLKTGQQQWQVSIDGHTGQQIRNDVLLQGDDLIICAPQITRLSGAKGKIVWQRQDLQIGESQVPSLLSNGRLFVVEKYKHLIQLDIQSGRTIASFPLPDGIAFSNIYPLTDRIYMRGFSAGSSASNLAGVYPLVVLDRRSGRVLWTLESQEPILSNIIEYGNNLYVGTSKDLVGIHRQSGKRLFSTHMTGVGDLYPVQVREVGNRIVYISELAIGACDPQNGTKLYRCGITPVSYLNYLESRIKQLQKNAVTSKAGSGKHAWSSYHSTQAALYQNLAQQAYANWDVSDSFESGISELKFSFHNQMAKAHSLRAFTASMDELSDAFEGTWKNLVKEAEIGYDRLLKRCILSSYLGMTREYIVSRPHVRDGFVYLRSVDLKSGRSTDLPLSPEYESFGIWNIVDPEYHVVYHHGLGLNPERYEYSEPCWNVEMVNAKWYKSHLLAIPLPEF